MNYLLSMMADGHRKRSVVPAKMGTQCLSQYRRCGPTHKAPRLKVAEAAKVIANPTRDAIIYDIKGIFAKEQVDGRL